MSLDLSSMGAFAPCPTLSTPPRGYKGGEFKLYEEARKNYDDARVVYTRLTSSSLGTSRIEKLTVDDLPKRLHDLYREGMLQAIVCAYNSISDHNDFPLVKRCVEILHNDEMQTCPPELQDYCNNAKMDWDTFKNRVLVEVKKLHEPGVDRLDLQVRKKDLARLQTEMETRKRNYEVSLGEELRDYQIANREPGDFQRGDFSFIGDQEKRDRLTVAFRHAESRGIWEKLAHNHRKKFAWGEEYYAHAEVTKMERALNRKARECGGMSGDTVIYEMEKVAKGWEEYVSAEIQRLKDNLGLSSVKRRRLD